MRVSSFALDPLGAKHIPQGLAEFIDPFANNDGQAGEKPPGAIFGVVKSEAQDDIGGNGRKRPGCCHCEQFWQYCGPGC